GWFDKWNADPIWTGFVYATITVTLERQAVLQADDDDLYAYTYYLIGQFRVELSASPRPNRRTVTKSLGDFGAGDKNNRRTGELREVPTGPEYNLGVEATVQDIIYTYPVPALTPFDYITVKCNDLLSELIVFLSQHDPQIVAGFEDRSEILPGQTY